MMSFEFFDDLVERYPSEPGEGLTKKFGESFENKKAYGPFRATVFPSVEEVANALMSSGIVRVEYMVPQQHVVKFPPSDEIKQVGYRLTRDEFVNIAENDAGERSYLIEVREHTRGGDFKVEGLKTNLWLGSERVEARGFIWEATLGIFYDNPGNSGELSNQIVLKVHDDKAWVFIKDEEK